MGLTRYSPLPRPWGRLPSATQCTEFAIDHHSSLNCFANCFQQYFLVYVCWQAASCQPPSTDQGRRFCYAPEIWWISFLFISSSARKLLSIRLFILFYFSFCRPACVLQHFSNQSASTSASNFFVLLRFFSYCISSKFFCVVSAILMRATDYAYQKDAGGAGRPERKLKIILTMINIPLRKNSPEIPCAREAVENRQPTRCVNGILSNKWIW